MDVQNFRMLQNFKYKELKLEEKLHKQKSILEQLRIEYASLKEDKEVKTTPAEKLKHKKNLRSIYTFKLPVSKQKNKNDIGAPERFRNGWIQRPLTDLPHKIQDLNKQRSRMIELGNSYSENNKKCPLATKTIRSVKTPHEMKYEMLNRAKLLGNHYSFRFRQHHSLKIYKKSIDSYKKHERLINQKNEMEEFFKNGGKLPQIFPQKYLHVLNEIYRLEEELNLNHQFSDGKICQEILNSDSSNDQKLIDQLSYPMFDNSDVVSDKIEMARAMERIDIGKILEATNIVEQRVSEEFWCREDVEEETKTDLLLMVLKNEEADSSDGKIDFKIEEIDSENAELPLEVKEFIPINEEMINIKRQEFDVESKELDMKNERFGSQSVEIDTRNGELDLKTENSKSQDFSTLKNLILEISDQALLIATSSTFHKNLKENPSGNHIPIEKVDSSSDTTNTFTPIFSQQLNSKLTETLKVFCENYIEDLFDMPNIPKHHPSFEDIRINFIHETTSNVDAGQESDDSQEISQVSYKICKSQSSILRTENVESSKSLEMTNTAILDENFITNSSKEDETCVVNKSYNYSREMASSSIEYPQSVIAVLYN